MIWKEPCWCEEFDGCPYDEWCPYDGITKEGKSAGVLRRFAKPFVRFMRIWIKTNAFRQN